MNQYLIVTTRASIFAFLIIFLFNEYSYTAVLTGSVTDSTSNEPLPGVTIRVEGSGQSMMANAVGQYRLLLPVGAYQLRFTHVGYYSKILEVQMTDSSTVIDVQLNRAILQLPGITVFESNYDPAQEIIAKAIARKEEILKRLNTYKFKAHVKTWLAEKTENNDSTEIKYLWETQLECLWSQPDKYTETIVARRQSANIAAELNELAIEEIPDFNRNRIEFEQYSIISPTATDALEHYNYYLIDTVFLDGMIVFRLEVEPKNEIDPLVTGTIDIADSSYEVVGLQGGLGKGIKIPFMENVRYRQSYSKFKDRYWMPTSIQMSCDVEFPILLGPSVCDYAVAIHDYDFDVALEPHAFDFSLEVSEDADSYDSSAWNNFQSIALTPKEKDAYHRIDSVKNLPKPFYKHMLSAPLNLSFLFARYQAFNFNRVEGAYLGFSNYWYNPLPQLELDTKFGYAFSREYWQYRLGAKYRLSKRQRIYAGAVYQDEIVHRPAILGSPDLSTAISALGWQNSSFDYYREKGFKIRFSAEFKRKITWRLAYWDTKLFSESKNTDFSLFKKDDTARINPPIIDGHSRAVSTGLTFDSRSQIKIKGRETYDMFYDGHSTVSLEVELSSLDFLNSDYDYIRYSLQGTHTGRSFLPGVSTFEYFLGGSDKNLPPHRFFTVNYDYALISSGMYYRTVGENNYSGNRAAAVYLSHNFGSWLFKKSGLPLVKKIPYSITVFGGAFWTDFDGQVSRTDDQLFQTAKKAYQELGFSIGGISSLGLELEFAWQLSDYNTMQFILEKDLLSF